MSLHSNLAFRNLQCTLYIKPSLLVQLGMLKKTCISTLLLNVLIQIWSQYFVKKMTSGTFASKSIPYVIFSTKNWDHRSMRILIPMYSTTFDSFLELC